jgi:hypothetical protein
LVPRYLAEQLTEDEAAAFEDALLLDPKTVADLELTLKLKEALAVLRDRGELASLLRPVPRRPWFLNVAAAALIILVLGGILWQRGLIPNLQSNTPALIAGNRRSLPVLGSFVLMRTREPSSVVDVPIQPRAGVIEVRVLPALFASGGRYTVRLVRLEATGGKNLGKIESLAPSQDRYVTVYLDQNRLTPGDYELSVAPTSAEASVTEADRFRLRVR